MSVPGVRPPRGVGAALTAPPPRPGPPVSDKNGVLSVPAGALAAGCPKLAVLDVSGQFDLDVASLPALAACRALTALELPWLPGGPPAGLPGLPQGGGGGRGGSASAAARR